MAMPIRRTILVGCAALSVAGCGTATAPGLVATRHTAAQPADPEAAKSFPLPAGVSGARAAPRPQSVPAARRQAATQTTHPSPGAPSDAEVRRELRQMEGVLRNERRLARAAGGGGAVAGDGTADVPAGAPAAVARVIAGGNAIARFPYVFGAGHASFVDSAYDCSASVSYALAAAGFVRAPLSSGELADWGAPGPGHWITVYANAGHTFMQVAGLRFDTTGRGGPFGSRWQTAQRSTAGFVARHWPGF
jgi:cell wall-associated NlpC family hydrolase